MASITRKGTLAYLFLRVSFLPLLLCIKQFQPCPYPLPLFPTPPPHHLRRRRLLGTHLLLLLFLMKIPHGGDQRDFEMPSLLGSPTKLIQEKLRHREVLYLRQYSSTLYLYNLVRVHFRSWPVDVVDQLITVKLSYESVGSKS